MRPDIKKFVGNLRQKFYPLSDMIESSAPPPSQWEMMNPFTRGLSEQIQIARGFAEAGYSRLLTGAHFPGLTPDELKLLQVDAMKNIAFSRVSLSVKTTDPSLRNVLLEEAAKINHDAEVLLGRGQEHESEPFDKI